MSFTPEQQEALNASLEAHGSKMLEQFTQTMNTALSGVAKRVSAETPKALEQRLATLETTLQSLAPNDEKLSTLITGALNKALEDLAATEDPAAGLTPAAGGAGSNDPAYLELKKQLEEQARLGEQMKQRLQQAETIADQERQKQTALAEQQRLAELEELFLTDVRGKVRPNAERDLLNLLKAQNLLSEESGQLLVKSKDDYGYDANIPIVTALPKLLEDRFAYLADVRPGTGTGNPGNASNTTGNPVNAGAGKFFAGGTKMPSQEELIAAMSDPAASTALFAELGQLTPSR